MVSEKLIQASKDMFALGVVKHNYDFLRKKKKKTRDIVRRGAENVVATSLLRAM